VAHLDVQSSPQLQSQDLAELHDPSKRDLLLTSGEWELRWPPGPGFGPSWVLAGLWHLQLWHPRSRMSVLVSHRSRWIDHHEIFLPEVGRRITRSPAALYALLEAHAIAIPNLDRVHRVAELAYDRALVTLSASAAAATRCPLHRARIASC
jgi:hypothetical protein